MLKIDTDGLPPRSVMELIPPRPIPDWLRTDLRVGHLPPAGWRMVDAYINGTQDGQPRLAKSFAKIT